MIKVYILFPRVYQRLFRLSSVENIRQYFHEVKDFYRNDMSEVGQTPIHFAAMTGQNHFVQNIIERIGAKVLLFRGNVFIKFSGPSESGDHSYCSALVGLGTNFYLGQKLYSAKLLQANSKVFSQIIKLKHYFLLHFVAFFPCSLTANPIIITGFPRNL